MPLLAPEPRRRTRSRALDFPAAGDVLRRLECARGRCMCHLSATKGHGVTHCPGNHDDQHPSLSVSERNGWTVWSCHAGCTNLEVRDALVSAGIWPKV